MSQKQNQEQDERGLGKVVYSVDSEEALEKRQEADAAQVTRASKESFPASDAPEFTGSTADPDLDPE